MIFLKASRTVESIKTARMIEKILWSLGQVFFFLTSQKKKIQK